MMAVAGNGGRGGVSNTFFVGKASDARLWYVIALQSNG